MIQKLSHATIYVLDQDQALDFYTNKLGFEVRMDMTIDNGFRWLAVGRTGRHARQNGVPHPLAGGSVSLVDRPNGRLRQHRIAAGAGSLHARVASAPGVHRLLAPPDLCYQRCPAVHRGSRNCSLRHVG